MTYILVFLLLIVILFIFVNIPFNENMTENYVNLGSYGDYPASVNEVLLEDSFPIKDNIKVTNKNESSIWWNYPIFKVGSYTQINNNLKYPNNPDTGVCMPSNFCGSIYKEHQIKTNISNVLPLVDSTGGTRVNYYNVY